MTKTQISISLIITTVLGALVGWAGSQHGQLSGGYPIYLLCVGVAFGLNWLAFVPAYVLQTEKFYDVVGSLTYIIITLIAVWLSDDLDTRSYVLAAMVLVWTLRLGLFLYTRIHRVGKDDRFDSIKPSFFRFLNAWTIQALWVIFTSSAAIIAITSVHKVDLGVYAYIGCGIWLIGFLIEVVADHQKSVFKKDAANAGKFIKSGLWSKSRHPNYFGEIVLWIGVLVVAIPVLQGWQWIAMISPLFVVLLLTRVSGIPMLEAKAEKKWGGQEEYEAYKKKTPILVPGL